MTGMKSGRGILNQRRDRDWEIVQTESKSVDCIQIETSPKQKTSL